MVAVLYTKKDHKSENRHRLFYTDYKLLVICVLTVKNSDESMPFPNSVSTVVAMVLIISYHVLAINLSVFFQSIFYSRIFILT